jgi:hypothetical protein
MTMFTLSLTFFTVKKFFLEFAKARSAILRGERFAHARGRAAAEVDPWPGPP